MKILVRGVAGNSNQVLIPRLLEARHEVVAIDVAAMAYPCACVRISITDELAPAICARGCDVIVHAAGTADHALPRTPKIPEAYTAWWEMSANSTHHLYRAALFAGVRKIIFLSTQEAYSSRTIRKTETKLGYKPRFAFKRYLEALGWQRRGDES